jgi:hypothetical protein
MFKGSWIVSVGIVYGIIGAKVMAAPSSVPASLPAPAKSAWTVPAPRLLRDIPQLQQKVSLAVTDQPVGDMLTSLSPTLSADLTAQRDVADQRVTLHITDQPVFVVMDRITRLLSHHADTSAGYHWSETDLNAAARPAFQMWRDSSSVREEQDALDYPQREMATLLRDMRNTAGMSPQEAAKYQGDNPYKVTADSEPTYAKAFQGLTDDQLDALMAGQGVPLDPTLFADEIAARRQRLADEQNGVVQGHIADPTEYLGLPVVPPNAPMMYVIPATANPDNTDSDAFSSYYVVLEGVLDGTLLVNTYDTNKNRDPNRMPQPVPPGPPGPVIDLTPLMMAHGVTHAQRHDLGFTLQALGRAAHINVYQEDFLRGSTQIEPSDPDAGTLDVGLPTLRAPLPVLIAAICAHWNYHWQKVGDDYLFWSRTWAQDRADDIPERLLGPWRKRFQKQGYLTLDDLAEMAAALTYPQIKRTLTVAMPEARTWTDLNAPSYGLLRFIGQLAPGQEQDAFSSGGLSLTALLPWQQEALTSGFGPQLQDVSDEQLARAVLILQLADKPKTYLQNVTLAAGVDGKPLFSTQCLIRGPTPLVH